MTNVFDNGETGDRRFLIDRDASGQLYVTTNAATREPVKPDQYRGWSADAIEEMRVGLLDMGVPADIVAEYIHQTEVWL